MTGVRAAVLAGLMTLGLLLQTAVFPLVTPRGLAPDLVLLVVVATAIAQGGEAAMLAGFAGGLLVDLAPPADHTAGRWALAMVVAGYLAGLVRRDAAASPATTALVVASCSFVATSVFALGGMVLGDVAAPLTEVLGVLAATVVCDVLLGLLLVPALVWLLRRPEPLRAAG